MKKRNLSQNIKKILWWPGCFLAAAFSFPVILLSFLLIYLAFSPIDVSGLGKHFIGTFYLNSKGDLTPVKKKAVGKEVWRNLKIQWLTPNFSDWLRHQNVGDIGFSLSGVRLVDLQGNEIDHLHKVEGKIAIALFSQGKVAIKSLEVEGLELRLKKLKTGEAILDFPGVHKNPNPSKPLDLSFLNRDLFQSLKFNNIHLMLNPEGEDHLADVKISDLHLQNFSDTNEFGKWEGKFSIFAKDGGKEASIVGVRHAGKPNGEKNWQVTFDLPAPQDFANILPIMDKIHLPLKANVTGEPMLCALGAKGCHLNVKLEVGKGYYIQPDNTKMQVLKASGEGSAGWKKDYKNLQAKVTKLDVLWLDSFGKETKEYLQATLGLDNLTNPHETSLSIGGRLPHFNIASLPTLWPQGLANGARKWIVENLTAGQADNFTLKVALKGNEGFDHLKVQEMSGALKAKDVTVHWLEEMPPFKGVSVSAEFLDSDNVLVKMAGGAINENPKAPIKLSTGSVAIRGVTSHKKQIAGRINLGLSGSVPKLVDILSRDRLPILKRFGKYYTYPKGSFNGKLMLDLPFAPWVKADDILFESEIKAQNLAVKLREIGQVSAFNGLLKARNKDLRIKAKALVRQIPIEMNLYDDLTANKLGQEMLNVHLTTPVNQSFLHKIGIPLSAERVSGNGLLEADISQPWSEKDHNETNMLLKLDMRGCSVESLLWRKAKNVPAGGALKASWVDDKLASVTDVTAYGPEIEVQADTLLKNHQIEGIDVAHLKIGKNEGRFRFEWPLITEEDAATSVKTTSQKYILAVNASKIDLEPFLKHTSTEMQDTLKGKKLSGVAQPVIKRKNGRTILPAGHWDINLKVAKAFLGQGRILGPLSILADWDKGHLKRADIEIEKPYKAFLKVSHSKDRKEEHFFEGGTDHLGEWLAWAKIYDALKGGKVSVSGKFAQSIQLASVTDPLLLQIEKDRKYYKRKKHRKDVFLKEAPEKEDKKAPPEEKSDSSSVHTEGLGFGLPPYAGKVSVEGMDWNSSLTGILLAKILSPTHWSAVNGNLGGISISGSVSVQDGIIGFGNIQGKSDILTATMVGNINLKKEKIALGGTVSPDYYWNSSLGRLPSVLGYIFSPQKGSGILAMGYTLDGELSQPHFNLNPYMMLLPGILRKIANPNI